MLVTDFIEPARSGLCYDESMRRTTVSLPEEVWARAEREARRRSTSVSEIVREALRDYLGLNAKDRRTLPFVALGKSGHKHTARDVERILAEEWGGARDRR